MTPRATCWPPSRPAPPATCSRTPRPRSSSGPCAPPPAGKPCSHRRWPPAWGARCAGRGPATRRAPAPEPISPRELEVLELVAQGASNRDTAAQLFISEATVKTHLMHIYAKLGVNDRAAAVAEGFNRGLLIPRNAR